MTKFTDLFKMSDTLGMRGMLTMWLGFFITSFGVLMTDDQTGPLRDFTLMSQLACCTNLATMGYSIANNVSMSRTMFYSLNFDTFATLLAFAYFGGDNLLNSTPLGIWNTVQLVGTVGNGVFGLASLYMVAGDHTGFEKYLEDQKAGIAV